MDIEENRFITSTKKTEDGEVENKLRPTRMTDYVGQEKLKESLNIFIKAAKMRSEPLDHVLLYGPPGLGKTTLSHIIANEINTQIKITSGPAIENAADLCAILTNLEENEVLFIDEIHRLNRTVEEVLYPAMEDYALDFIVGKGPSARSMRLKIKPFTLIGATTRAGNLTNPLRDRFGVIGRLENYKSDELKTIVIRSAKILGVNIDNDGAKEIAVRSRGTPRITNRLLKRVRDYAQVGNFELVTKEVVDKALKMMEVDSIGLDYLDRRILTTIIEKFNGGPVGLDTLAATTGEERITIEDVYEPFLLQIGFIARTPKGRIVLDEAYKHLGLNSNKRKQTIFDTRTGDTNV